MTIVEQRFAYREHAHTSGESVRPVEVVKEGPPRSQKVKIRWLDGEFAALEETRAVAVKELEAIRTRWKQHERLEHDAEALLEHYAGMIPEALDDLTSKEHHDVYKMMRLKVLAFPDGSVEVTGVFGEPLEVGASRSVKTEGKW